MSSLLDLDTIGARLAACALPAARLADDVDGMPIFLHGPCGEGERRALIIVSSGDCLLAHVAALQLLEGGATSNWSWYFILPAEPQRTSQSGGLIGSDSLFSHVTRRRIPHGPGEWYEENIPFANSEVWQPDHEYSELSVPSSPASIAAARAIHAVEPHVIISLADKPGGGWYVESSQKLLVEDWHFLTQDWDVEINDGGKLSPGVYVNDCPGLYTLPSLTDDLARAPVKDSAARWAGGIRTWQATNALYGRFTVPWYAHPPNETPAVQELSWQVGVELVEEDHALVNRLHDPDSSFHGTVVRIEKWRGDPHPEQTISGIPASGMLAALAQAKRSHIYTQLSELLLCVRPACTRGGADRPLQLLSSLEESERKQLFSFVNNKRFGRPARPAEQLFYTSVYPLQTALVLGEARICMQREDVEDSNISQAIAAIDELIIQTLDCLPPLNECVEESIAVLVEGAQRLCRIYECGGPQLQSAITEFEQLPKMVNEAKRAARNAVNRKAPRKERVEATSIAEELEKQLSIQQESLDIKRTIWLKNLASNKPVAFEETSKKTQEKVVEVAPSVDKISKEDKEQNLTEREVNEENNRKEIVDKASLTDETDQPQIPSEESSLRAEVQNNSEEELKNSKTPQIKSEEKAAVKQEEIVEDSLVVDEKPESEILTEKPLLKSPDVKESASDTESPDLVTPEPAMLKESLGAEGCTVIASKQEEVKKSSEPNSLDTKPSDAVAPKPALQNKEKPSPTKKAVDDQVPQAEKRKIVIPTEEDIQRDWDAILPLRLPLGREWGRGPLDWPAQIPDVGAVFFAEWDGTGKPPAPPSSPQRAQGGMQAAGVKVEIVSLGTQRVGFVRQRISLAPRQSVLLNQLAIPQMTGGIFVMTERNIH